MHAACIRPYSHSYSDDERQYKSKLERDEEAARDPLQTFPRFLVQEGLAAQEELDTIAREIDTEVAELTDRVLREAGPSKNSVFQFLYSDRIDPTSSDFEIGRRIHALLQDQTEVSAQVERGRELVAGRFSARAQIREMEDRYLELLSRTR